MGEYSCFGEGQYRKRTRTVVLVPSPFCPLSSFLQERIFPRRDQDFLFFFKVLFY